MSTKVIIIAIAIGFLSLLGIGGGSILFYGVGIRNQAVELETQFSAQIEANKSTYDKMWKIIQQKAGISQQYASDFKSNFAAIMEGRYGNPANRGQSLMLWIQEKNPEFSIELYKDLSRSVESLRIEFDISQKKMIDIKRVHDNLRLKFPSSLAMFGHNELQLKLVTSDRTERAFETGKDNDVDLFKKN
jgi:hypothetical protein